MSVEKMKLLGITGNSKNLDKFLANVLFKSDVQIEDAKKIYNKGWKLTYYEYDYKIKETLKKCEKLFNKIGVEYHKESNMVSLVNQVSNISNKIDELDSEYEESIKQIQENQKKNEENVEKINNTLKLENINMDFQKLYNLQYIKFRYGSIPKKNLEEIKKELDNLNTIIFE